MLRRGAVFPATLARGCVPHKRRGPLESGAYKNQVGQRVNADVIVVTEARLT